MTRIDLIREVRRLQTESDLSSRSLAQLQNELRDLKLHYTGFFDGAPVGYLTLDNNGSIVEANGTLGEMLGVSAPYLIGRQFSPFVFDVDRETFLQLHAHLQTSDSFPPTDIRLQGSNRLIVAEIYPLQSTGFEAEGLKTHSFGLVDTFRPDAYRGKLRAAEFTLRSLVKSASTGVVLTDELGYIVQWDTGMELVTGLIEVEVFGNPLWTVLSSLRSDEDPAYAVRLRKYMSRLLQTGEHGRFDQMSRIQLTDADGETRHVELSIRVFPVDIGFILGCVLHESSDRIAKLDDLHTRLARRRFLDRAAQTLIPAHEREQAVQTTLEGVVDLLDADVGYIWLTEETNGTEETTGVVCQHGALRGGIALDVDHPADADWSARWVIEHGGNQRIGDLSQQSQAQKITATEAEAHRHSSLCVPIRSEGKAVGAIQVLDARLNYFRYADTRFLEMLAVWLTIAIENQQLLAQSQDLAVVEERQRFARDLHDAVSQSLFSAGLLAETLPSLWQKYPNEVAGALDDLRFLVLGATAELRTLVGGLRPADLASADLGELLRLLAHAFTGREGSQVELSLEGHEVLPDRITIAFYRIAQEAMHNIAKHADASLVQVQLNNNLEGIKLQIADNGHGFDSTSTIGGHYGLKIMRERADEIGATFSLVSGVGEGTSITVQLLLSHANAD